MKLKPEQLPAHLKHTCLPIYWLSGDEPLLLEEAAQYIRQAAKSRGFEPDEIFTVTGKFNWQAVFIECANRSLLNPKRLIELRLSEYALGQTGSKLLKEYTQRPHSDVVLLITSHKLEKQTFTSTYMKAIDAIGGIIQLWPIDREQLPQWLKTRLQQAGLRIDADALALFADCVEGNLLAAKQMIDRFALLHGTATLTQQNIEQAISDFSYFDVFTLVDSCLASDTNRILHILQRLKANGTESVLVLWALSREIRQLAQMAFALQQNNNIHEVLQEFRVWPKRQNSIRNALQQHHLQHWYKLLQRAQAIDVMIKSYQATTIWQQLERLCLLLGNTR